MVIDFCDNFARPMIEQFVQRNLNRTVDFLCRTGNGSAAMLPVGPLEQQAIAMQNGGNWIGAYRRLLCEASSQHPEIIFFCSCCGAVRNFLRNHSLVLHDQHKTTGALCARGVALSPDFGSDPFCDYIIALCKRDVPLLLECIALLPLFWDAYALLADITDRFIFVDGPLSPYFYMLLKVKKDMDPPECTADFIKGTVPSLDILPYEVQTEDLNLLGAFLYAYGHTDAAGVIFDGLFFGIRDGDAGAGRLCSRDGGPSTHLDAHPSMGKDVALGKPEESTDTRHRESGGGIHSPKHATADRGGGGHSPGNGCMAVHAQCAAINAALNRKARNGARIEQLVGKLDKSYGRFCTSFEYADVAAYILLTKNSPRLLCLIELLKMDHPNTPETYTARGIYQSSLENHKRAKHFFKKSLQVRPSLDVLAMLAHTHIHLNERTEAIEAFAAALRLAPPSFRLLYSIAQGYFRLRMFEQSLFYARQALQAKSDGAVWKLVGRVHLQLQDYSAGAHALHKAVRMGEPDALLYLAELYKKLGRHERVAEFYEKYVQVGEKNKTTVLSYLIEYFKERGDVEKSSLYRSMLL